MKTFYMKYVGYCHDKMPKLRGAYECEGFQYTGKIVNLKFQNYELPCYVFKFEDMDYILYDYIEQKTLLTLQEDYYSKVKKKIIWSSCMQEISD